MRSLTDKKIALMARFVRMLLLAGAFALLASCGRKEKADEKIRVVVQEVRSEGGALLRIPSFESEDEQVQKKLRSLEKQTLSLRRIVEREEKKGGRVEMDCYVVETAGYPQATVVWHVSEEGKSSYDLMTLAVDEALQEPLTCKEALERTGMSGVDLSLAVGRLAQEEERAGRLGGELSSTEMQGFLLGVDGRVAEIYMKLTMDVEDGEKKRTEEHFFSYLPDEERMESLSGRGFDLP